MNKEIKIRPYKETDREQVQNICIETSFAAGTKQKELRELVLNAFCNYYIDNEPENCFVAVDGDIVAGYILCAENSAVCAEKFAFSYSGSPQEEFYKSVVSAPLRYIDEHPSHLHIDILPQYQRMGIGHMLMDRLIDCLCKKNIPGIMLGVAADNEKGVHFYHKYGFHVIAQTEQEISMGLNLNKVKSSFICNPVNVPYRYQFNKNPMTGEVDINRESADPSMICFKGKYYIFASMTLGVFVSEDMVQWEYKRLPDTLPLYGYAPDARVCGEFVYFCSNESDKVCHFYRTKDILNGPYEKIEGSFSFLDPNFFADDDGRFYFYWGLSCKEPIYGVELDAKTMLPIGGKKELIQTDPFQFGYERIGEDNTTLPCSAEELQRRFQGAKERRNNADETMMSVAMEEIIKDMLRDAPYLEGAWMNKFAGKYYLQYAVPGTHFNVYGDGVYVSEHPLGPFKPAENNPYSYKPGGFIPGAGHGSTMEDRYGNLWHAATMRISMNHQFERRIGYWPAGIDKDGELFCNQRYGDWPMRVEQKRVDPWKEPEWYLLSLGKQVSASSYTEGHEPKRAVDENVRTWWQAAGNESGEWLEIDLGQEYDTHAIQINFADDRIIVPVPEDAFIKDSGRYIEERPMCTRWILEGALDRDHYFMIEEKSEAETDLAHDFILDEAGIRLRYLRLTICEVPYGQKPCISGLRVFGIGKGKKPEIPEYQVERVGELDMKVEIKPNGALGYNILWGNSAEKLYHSYMVFETQKRIGALAAGRGYYVRVDAFNEAGITEGELKFVEAR